MRFTFEVIKVDGELRTRWDVLLRINASFSIVFKGKTLYNEVEFPVVEFAVQLADWLARLSECGPEFCYTSAESDREGLVRITPLGDGQWRVSALDQRYDEAQTCATDEVRRSVAEYINAVRSAAQRVAGVDIFQYFSSEAGVRAVLDRFN